MKIFREFRFESAHRLPHVPARHKCGHLHGHSYRCIVHVSGTPSTSSGWIMDFAEIDEAVAPVRAVLDHHYLNEIPGLENPTSEVLVRWIWQKLAPVLPGLSEVVVRETCTSGCVYRGEDE